MLRDGAETSVLMKRWIDWRNVGSKLQLLDLALNSDSRGLSIIPDKVLCTPTAVQERRVDAEWNAALFMATVLSESVSTDNRDTDPDVKLIYMYDVIDGRRIIVVAQSTSIRANGQRRTRVIDMADPFGSWVDPDLPHSMLAAHITSLTLPSDVLCRNISWSTSFSTLLKLAVLFDCDVTEHPDADWDDDGDEAEPTDDGAETLYAFELVLRCRGINCPNIIHEHKQRKNPPVPNAGLPRVRRGPNHTQSPHLCAISGHP